MNKGIIILVIVIILVVLGIVFIGPKDAVDEVNENNLDESGGVGEEVEYDFKKVGVIVFNNPGMDGYYLVYDEEGAPGSNMKLVFDDELMEEDKLRGDLEDVVGKRVSVEGNLVESEEEKLVEIGVLTLLEEE